MLAESEPLNIDDQSNQPRLTRYSEETLTAQNAKVEHMGAPT